MLPREGGFAIMLQETGIATRAQEMHVAAAPRDKGYTPFFSSWLAETGPPPPREGEASSPRSAASTWRSTRSSVSRKLSREGRSPGDPHRRGGPHPHQRPRTAGRLLPMGGKGGVLGRHTNVCHGAQPRWETPGGTPTSTWLPPPTRPRSTSGQAGRPAVSGGRRHAARRT